MLPRTPESWRSLVIDPDPGSWPLAERVACAMFITGKDPDDPLPPTREAAAAAWMDADKYVRNIYRSDAALALAMAWASIEALGPGYARREIVSPAGVTTVMERVLRVDDVYALLAGLSADVTWVEGEGEGDE